MEDAFGSNMRRNLIGTQSLWGGFSVALVTVAFVLGGCSSGTRRAALRTTQRSVGTRTEIFVDASRPTPASGSAPRRPNRSLETVIYYPTDRSGGPYPLIAFAHGLDDDPVEYQVLLRAWAAAGYVVAAPRFPLTNMHTPGGTDPADLVNQPADISFVISTVLDASRQKDGVLAGLIDPHTVGAAGHSLGGGTTLGLVANRCCHDDRVKAAVVMAAVVPFPTGTFDYNNAPAILLVHGTTDPLVAFASSVDVFNQAKTPKGLLTIKHGDHTAPFDPKGGSFTSVVRDTTNFFDAYLKGNTAARRRLDTNPEAGTASLQFASKLGSHVTIATTTTIDSRNRQASVTPHTNLSNGQSVTVEWSGYNPDGDVNIFECSKSKFGDASACNFKMGRMKQLDPTGAGKLSLQVVTGTVGTGTCDAAHPGCVIVVNDTLSDQPSGNVLIPITFAP